MTGILGLTDVDICKPASKVYRQRTDRPVASALRYGLSLRSKHNRTYAFEDKTNCSIWNRTAVSSNCTGKATHRVGHWDIYISLLIALHTVHCIVLHTPCIRFKPY